MLLFFMSKGLRLDSRQMGSIFFDMITYLKGEVKVWKIQTLSRNEYISL